MDKKRIVKDYDKLSEDVIEGLKLKYPSGYSDYLISIVNKEGKNISVLPFETEDTYFLIRMTASEAERLIAADEDFDKNGNLKEELNTGIPNDEESEMKEEDEEDDYEDVSVRLRGKKGSGADSDGYDDEDEEPSETPDYF